MLRVFAHIVSVIFHPLLILTYMLVILLAVNPYLFGVNNVGDHTRLILIVFFSTFFIPAFAVLLMKPLGLISSIQLKDKQERVIPFIATGVFYLWMFFTIQHNPEIPLAFKSFVLGATIALFLCFFINLFSKISAHAAGMGGLVGMIILTIAFFSYESISITVGENTTYEFSTSILLFIALLLAGVVGTARLILDAHHIRDLSGGFLVGLVAQLIALNFLM